MLLHIAYRCGAIDNSFGLHGWLYKCFDGIRSPLTRPLIAFFNADRHVGHLAKSRIRFGISIIGVECRVDFDIRTLRVLCFARAAASIVYCQGHGHYADGPDRDASLDDVGIRSNIPLSPGGECDYRASYFTSFGFRGRCGDGPLDSWHIGFSGIASSFVLTGHSLFC